MNAPSALARLGLEPLSAASAEPLYAQLAGRLADAIAAGRLAAGEQLPTEPALMAAFGISRVTVRQALQRLVHNGLLVAHRGKGTFVARAAFQQDLSSLQGFQHALRSQGVEPQTELLEFTQTAGAADPALPAGLDLTVRLRRLYRIDNDPFALVEAWLPADAAAVGEARARRLAVYDILQRVLGLRIGRAEVAIQCTRAGAPICRLLGLPARSHVLRMNRTSFTATGTPCEHMRISIVPDRYTFRMNVPGPLQLASAIRPSASASG